MSFDATTNLDALTHWLATNVSGFRGPVQLDRFEGGQSNPSYKVTASNATYVLRSKPAPVAQLLKSAHAIEREFAVMSALANSHVPVPQVFALCEDESVIGRAFYVMAHVQGRVLWDQSLPDMTRHERGAIYDEMNRVLAELHRVNPTACGLGAYGKPGSYFERQIARWSQQYRASADGVSKHSQPIAAMEALIDWLPNHLPDSAKDASQVSIVHGDYRLDNLIFHPTEAKILAVLDWELSTLGHPLADFSYHCMAWHIPPGAFRGIAGLNLETLGIPTESDYIRRYCERTGQHRPEALAADWNFYMAYNLFRMAAILQGIAKRIEQGTAASEQAQRSAAGARPLADLALQFARA